MIYDNKNMTGFRALRLWKEGVDLTCPICGTELSVIPEGLPRTEMPLGLFCPKNKQHVYMYGETREAFEPVRSIIRGMIPKTNINPIDPVKSNSPHRLDQARTAQQQNPQTKPANQDSLGNNRKL